jgi:acyl-CoA hydrolase
MGWVNTALVEKNENFIDPYDAALIMVNLMEDKPYIIPEIVVGNKQLPRKDTEEIVASAADYMVESITQSNRLAFKNADK